MKKKGFTLIELLAVIIILSVIALIAVPKILGIMKDVRRSSFKSSASGIVESTKNYYSKQTGNYDFTGEVFKFNNNKPNELDYDGKNPTEGHVTLKENGEIELYVTDGEFCAYKSFDNTNIIVTDITEKGCGKIVDIPTISVAGKKITSDTISLQALCTLEENSEASIVKYEFSKDGGINWDSKIVDGNYLNYFTYSDLKQTEEFNFKARCITDTGISSEKNVSVSLQNINKPEISIPSGWAREKTITISFPKGRYKYQISEDEGKTWIDVETISGELANTYTKTYQSNITILAKVLDKTGNYVNSDSAKITGIDRIAPTCGTFKGNTTWTKNNVTVKLSCTDDYSGCTASTYDVKTFSSGTVKTSSVSYTIKDNAGNTTSCSGTANVYLDKEGPTCGTFTGNSSWTKNNVTVKLSCTDSGSGCTESTYNAKTFSSGTVKTSSVSYTIKDNAGNTTSCSGTTNVYLDKEGPSKPSIVLYYGSSGSTSGLYSNGSWTKYDVLTEANSSDSGVGISYYQYSHDGVNWSNDITSLGWSTAYYNGKNKLHYWITWSGAWAFTIRAVDSLGNVSTTSDAFILQIDKNSPTVSFSPNGTGGSWNSNSATTITVNDSESGIAVIRGRWMEGDGHLTTSPLTSESDFTGAGGWTVGNGGVSNGNPTNGIWYLWVYTRDFAGNETITHTNQLMVGSPSESSSSEPATPSTPTEHYVGRETVYTYDDDFCDTGEGWVGNVHYKRCSCQSRWQGAVHRLTGCFKYVLY
ncbi:MAG: prepilin-type N-terminal cleavage/methylation domain-containing protein [Bacilli bacterium]|nr:prepilin-type N-terminal cleavage/methylation domain-containing protein [Bacilli bacterium]MBP3445594.1 prepilin-type N-terminal cleavage/methylation domain-containing protein [Bacilli bacterium]